MADQSADAAADDERVEERRSSPLKSPRVRLALLVGAIAIVAAGLLWYFDRETRGKYMQSTDNAYVSADSVVVAPKIAGYVERVLVTENQAVRQGQPLAELDPREYRAQTQQITSQIEAATASTETTRSQIAEQQAAIAQAQAQLGSARAEAVFAAQQVERYQPLAASGAEPRERLAQLQTQARQARERVDAAEAGLLAAQRRVGTLGAQVRQAQSQAEAARAQLAAARVNVESTLLRAAIDGRVGDLAVRVGQFVQPGTRMMTLVPVDRLFIEANFKETQLGLMRVGQPVRIEVDALPGIELTGRVASFAPGTGAQFSVLPPQNATGNFTKIVQRVPVRIAIEAPPEVRRLLVPGMSVEATVDTRSAKGELDRIRRVASEER
ncbi:HlyD family secretion protein [Sphingosinicella soli]|jgi:membrane fusion protein, multidrug efflux system|uniref:Membrane fusion protein (Multidrug efflux system) n=1 Tax=Sphingosinicella soli TaxID=333708 RepID=A0A7W7AZ86_9SPHN|nr:HlyD family secretion protein [Sphingosinicella soli]MBB4631091.1 membrane fusion protein (multidrug efflux system) [Sphingosinicella soli]